MFTKEDVQQLVESVNVGTITDDEKGVLVEDLYGKLTEAFERVRREAVEESAKTAEDKLRRERVKSFRNGADSAREKCESAIHESEGAAFQAGREQGLREAAEEEEEVSDQLVEKIEELCKEFDITTRLVEIATQENAREYFKESTQKAISEFVERKIEESFPQKTIVNYDRLNRLEKVFESLRTTLAVNDATVCEARDAAVASVRDELADAKAGLHDATKRRIAAEQMLESVRAENHLLRKVAPLPASDQRRMMSAFKGATVAQIDESFDSEYQRLLRRNVAAKPVVSDVIMESSVAKTLAREAISRAKPISESADKPVQKTASDALMDAYVANCRHMRM